ncbi:hypothetical protein HK096_003808 [Nowakowskiella sp. JEL0078]|nr:hypothetical protein HK096_003808 [Nowakowskiella sp. JEL0078]
MVVVNQTEKTHTKDSNLYDLEFMIIDKLSLSPFWNLKTCNEVLDILKNHLNFELSHHISSEKTKILTQSPKIRNDTKHSCQFCNPISTVSNSQPSAKNPIEFDFTEPILYSTIITNIKNRSSAPRMKNSFINLKKKANTDQYTKPQALSRVTHTFQKQFHPLPIHPSRYSMKLPQPPFAPTFAPFQIRDSIIPPSNKPQNSRHSLTAYQLRETQTHMAKEWKKLIVLSAADVRSKLTQIGESKKIHTRVGSAIMLQKWDVIDEKKKEIDYSIKSAKEGFLSKYNLLPSISQTKNLLNKDVSKLHLWNSSTNSSTSKASISSEIGPNMENDDSIWVCTKFEKLENRSKQMEYTKKARILLSSKNNSGRYLPASSIRQDNNFENVSTILNVQSTSLTELVPSKRQKMMEYALTISKPPQRSNDFLNLKDTSNERKLMKSQIEYAKDLGERCSDNGTTNQKNKGQKNPLLNYFLGNLSNLSKMGKRTIEEITEDFNDEMHVLLGYGGIRNQKRHPELIYMVHSTSKQFLLDSCSDAIVMDDSSVSLPDIPIVLKDNISKDLKHPSSPIPKVETNTAFHVNAANLTATNINTANLQVSSFSSSILEIDVPKLDNATFQAENFEAGNVKVFSSNNSALFSASSLNASTLSISSQHANLPTQKEPVSA